MPAAVAFVSNGHGEDAIAAAIIRHLPAGTRALALPLVGRGEAYRGLAGVEVVGPARAMPSGGFIVRKPGALLRDLQAGLAGLAGEQWGALRARRGDTALAVAVGDITALLFALALPRPRVFVGTAKSEHYHDWGERYFGLERWLLRRHARRVFARDACTAAALRRDGVPAEFAGNPIMDGLEAGGDLPPALAALPLVALLPGSRADAYGNWPILLAACEALHQDRPDLLFAAALPPALDQAPLLGIATELGWHEEAGGLLHRAGTRVFLLPGRLGALLPRARLCIGLSGTGNEQAVGMGVPVLAFVSGAQYTPYFARRQQHLLGEALTLGPADGPALARLALPLLDDERYRARVQEIGHERFGDPGAGARIAAAIASLLRD